MNPQTSKKVEINLEYRARQESKRHSKKFESTKPFPKPINGKFIGIFTGISIEITQKEAISEIYANGNYGKGSHSRSAPAILRTNCENKHETLVLQLEEAAFLAYFIEILEIQSLDGSLIDWQQFFKAATTLSSNFVNSFAAYLYLKSKGWIVKSGLKFGGDFTIYKHGPECYHASFVVHIVSSNETSLLVHKNLKGLQRVAETSNKDVLLLEITTPVTFNFKSLSDLQNIEISETIVRRIKLSSFVQCPNINK